MQKAIIGIFVAIITTTIPSIIIEKTFSYENSYQSFSEKNLLSSIQQLSLVTIVEKRQIVSSSTHKNWRGSTKAEVSCPALIHYSVDLSQIKRENIQIKDKKITISIPLAKVHAIEIDEKKAEVRLETGWARLQSLSGQCQESIARSKLYEIAKNIANQDEYILSSSQRSAYILQEKIKVLFPEYHVIVTCNS